MIGLYVSVPVACFRKGLAREFFETHLLPPPSTCYGMLLSLVGETDRRRHRGCRVTASLLDDPPVSVVLRTMWRVKNKGNADWPMHPGQNPPSHYPSKIRNRGGNVVPDFQQLLTDVRLVLWLDSTDETDTAEQPTLEARVAAALDPRKRHNVARFGGLSFGESTHLIDEVTPLTRRPDLLGHEARTFVQSTDGQTTLPVWVDHVGSAGTRYATGSLRRAPLAEPSPDELPRIADAA